MENESFLDTTLPTFAKAAMPTLLHLAYFVFCMAKMEEKKSFVR